jgi:hypothetical protein
MIAEQINQTDWVATPEDDACNAELNDLLFEICGGRRIYDLDLVIEALRERMYWWCPVLSEIQEEHIQL